jgi:HAE1 family hydrophobic/amphiphilic exporter-1
LDREKLNRAQLSATMIAGRLGMTGQNIPAGSVSRETNGQDMVFRTVGEFETVQAIKEAAINFFGNDRALTLSDVGSVRDTLADPTNYTYLNGDPTLLIYVYKQSGANTVAVADLVKKATVKINTELQTRFPEAKASLAVVSNQARYISLNVEDVEESIFIGIMLTILVVYFFLGSLRSTLITGVAIPVSLIGAFFLMSLAGFSINIMSLLAFSLAVGLLIDDAIVVRENIFRHMEMGKSPRKAALEGTVEVTMAVVAVTLTIIAVFMPIGFLSGVIGQFMKQFGLSVCFIMAISLFDALTNAPMMSAYFGGTHGAEPTSGFFYYVRTPVRMFNSGYSSLEKSYSGFLQWILRRPWVALVGTVFVVASSCVPLMKVPKTFLPAQDSGEYSISLDMAPGTSLEKMRDRSLEIIKDIHQDKYVVNSVLTVGSRQGEKNKADINVYLTKFGERDISTSAAKDLMRARLKKYADCNPVVKDIDYVGGGMRPFTVNIIGQDLAKVEEIAGKVAAKLKSHPALKDVDTSFRPGKPEYQVIVNLDAAQRLGVSSSDVGRELRAQVEGLTPAVFRENGLEYDIRVRMKPEQRDLEKAYSKILVPNMNMRLVQLSSVAKAKSTTGPASINRENRGRYAAVTADIAPTGPGLGGAMADLKPVARSWRGVRTSARHDLPVCRAGGKLSGDAAKYGDCRHARIDFHLSGSGFPLRIVFTPLTIMLVIPTRGLRRILWSLHHGQVAGSLFNDRMYHAHGPRH